MLCQYKDFFSIFQDSDCQNHIRVILEREDKLDICGTGGYSPMNFKLDVCTIYHDWGKKYVFIRT